MGFIGIPDQSQPLHLERMKVTRVSRRSFKQGEIADGSECSSHVGKRVYE